MVQLNTASGDGGLRVNVDALGAFGSASSGVGTSDAFYDPIGSIAEAGTTFDSGVAFRAGETGTRTFLSTLLADSGFVSNSETEALSTFGLDNLNFELTQTVTDLVDGEDRAGSRLTQRYAITNSGSESVTFELIRYFDGDLDFDGSLLDGGGRLMIGDQEILFETDTAGESADSTTFIGITAEGGEIQAPGRFEIDQFPDLQNLINSGNTLDDMIADGEIDPDIDDDGFVDAGAGFDITLGLRNSFTLAPGESTFYTTTTSFGTAAPDSIDTTTSTLTGTEGDDTLTGTGFSEIFNGLGGNDQIDAGGGNDIIDPGAGDAIINAGPGDDRIIGSGQPGQDLQIDGGDGFDTVVYDGNFADFPVEVIDPVNLTIQVGSSTDTLTNVEQLEFADQTIATSSLLPEGAFTEFDPTTDDPQTLVDAIVNDSGVGIVPDSVVFAGAAGQASLYNGTLNALGIGSGILLTSGDGSPAEENMSTGLSVQQTGNSDADLQSVADSAFDGAGTVQDANTLEFSFTITDPEVESVRFDLVFGSEEFPEFSNSTFVDAAGVFVNGENVALFNNNAAQPLSVINNNLEVGNFIDNSDNSLPIEYDGVSSVLTIFASVNQGVNSVKFGVADTGDQSFDSGLFIANFATSTLNTDVGGGSGVLLNIVGTPEDDMLSSSDLEAELNEFFDAQAGNDVINAGAGNDFIDAGAGNDTIDPGSGSGTIEAGPGDDLIMGLGQPGEELQIDGGNGFDTVVYAGNFADFDVSILDVESLTLEVGGTDILENVEALQFEDQTIAVSDLDPMSEGRPVAEDAEFTVLEHSAPGTVVGTIVATDPNATETPPIFTFDIIGGNPDDDQDGEPAFAVDTSIGQIVVNDSNDIDFETNPEFNLRIRVTDAEGLTDLADATVSLGDQQGVFFDTETESEIVRTFDETLLTVSIAEVDTELDHQIVVFLVDDEAGTVNGVAADESGYVDELLANDDRLLTTFSVLASDNPSGLPSGFDFDEFSRTLNLIGGQHFGFALIRDGNINELRAGVDRDIFLSTVSGSQISSLGDDGFMVSFDEEGGNSFGNITLQVQATAVPLMSNLALQALGLQDTGLAAIDLRDQVTGMVAVDVQVRREADEGNFVGFYQVTDTNGGIDTNGDGVADVLVGDAAYTETVVNQRIDFAATSDGASNSFTANLMAGGILVPFILTEDDNPTDGFASEDVYVPFIGANEDGRHHILLLGDNTFGFEDRGGGGDLDFDDLIVKIDFQAI